MTGTPKKYNNPFPTQSKEGQRWWYLVAKKGVSPEDAAVQAKTPGKVGNSKKREVGGNAGRKPDLVKPPKKKKNGTGAKNGKVLANEILQHPGISEAVKDQVRAATDPTTLDKKDNLTPISPSSRPRPAGGSDSQVETASRKIDPPVPGPHVFTHTEITLNRIAGGIEDLCAKLDTLNRNLVTQKWGR